MSARILVVDDEPDLVELVRVSLAQAGFEVASAATGAQALEALRRSPPDLLVLDVMLPDVSGTDVCRRVRADSRLAQLPILMLTAKSEEIDRVVGFELGADDYVTKPFSPRELVLRVRAILRRGSADGASEGGVLEADDLRVETDSHRCLVDGIEVPLTTKEFGLLVALMRRPGRVLTRERLLDDVWGRDISVTARTIDTHMKRLREKLGERGGRLETVRGVGYRFSS